MKSVYCIAIGVAVGLAAGLALSVPWAQEAEETVEMGKVISKQFQQYHTKGEPDDVYIFQTKYKKGTQIMFRHKYHIEDVGLQCVDCHHVESCTKCHLKNEPNTLVITEGKTALHKNCMGCHAEIGGPTQCDDCHQQ